jgi:hypothetical protein
MIDDILFAVDMSTNVVCTAHPSEYWISELPYFWSSVDGPQFN